MIRQMGTRGNLFEVFCGDVLIRTLDWVLRHGFDLLAILLLVGGMNREEIVPSRGEEKIRL